MVSLKYLELPLVVCVCVCVLYIKFLQLLHIQKSVLCSDKMMRLQFTITHSLFYVYCRRCCSRQADSTSQLMNRKLIKVVDVREVGEKSIFDLELEILSLGFFIYRISTFTGCF